tara:strand:- start:1155 stop:1439 length:285 start_codon:yes stop_codon:yes gene_type:complete
MQDGVGMTDTTQATTITTSRLNETDARGQISPASRTQILTDNPSLAYIDPSIDNPNLGRFVNFIEVLNDGRILIETGGTEWKVESRHVQIASKL